MSESYSLPTEPEGIVASLLTTAPAPPVWVGGPERLAAVLRAYEQAGAQHAILNLAVFPAAAMDDSTWNEPPRRSPWRAPPADRGVRTSA